VAGPEDRELYQELRLALVFNGGVSLAVWMGGVAKEIDRFRCAFHSQRPELAPYRELLAAVRTEVMTDIVAGTSAGGINGALLAYVVGNGKSLECAGADEIRDTWRDLGAIEDLLTYDVPLSALDGDKLLQGCADIFGRLSAAQADLDEDVSTRVRLTITATDSYGYEVKAAGVTGRDHRLEMRFRRVDQPSAEELEWFPELIAAMRTVAGPEGPDGWPFATPPSPRDLNGPGASALLTRATRTTASFPIAFAPSALPLNVSGDPLPSDAGGLTATPPMVDVLESNGGPGALDPSVDDAVDPSRRYAIDGGLWDNSPFGPVLRAIDRTPSDRDLRRVVTYVVATPAPPVKPSPNEPPKLFASLLGAVALPANVSFANDLARIKTDLERQQVREETIDGLLLPAPTELFATAAQVFPLYVEQRKRANLPPLSLETLPGRTDSLATWLATPEGWAWGSRPVRTAIREGRRLLRLVLGDVAATAPDPVAVGDVIAARQRLSLLARAIDDLDDHRAGAADGDVARVCGQAMHDFASTLAGVRDEVAALQPTGAKGAEAIAATVGFSTDGADMVVKRALAVEVVLNAVSADARPHKVNYRLETIRPADAWPLPSPANDPTPDAPRGALQGASLHHFGGFLRASWRLSDWTWGRLDGVGRLVDMLLDAERIDRLTINRAQVADLAATLARVAVPEGAYDRARDLAFEAYDARNLAESAGDGPASAAALSASGDERDELVKAWQARLSTAYEDELASGGAADGIRADVRRRFSLAILEDEIDAIAEAVAQESDTPIEPEGLGTLRDRGLRELARVLVELGPDRREQIQDGERAAANVLVAIEHPHVASAVRAIAATTGRWRAMLHGARAAARYIRHRQAKPD